MMQEEHARELYVKIKTLQEHMQKIQQHLQEVEHKRAQLRSMQEAVKESTTLTENDEILAPLTNGIFIKATPAKETTLVLNVGSDVCVEKTPAQATKLLDDQDRELIEFKQQLQNQLRTLQAEHDTLEEQVMEALSDDV